MFGGQCTEKVDIAHLVKLQEQKDMLSKAARRALLPSMTRVSPRVIQGDIVIKCHDE